MNARTVGKLQSYRFLSQDNWLASFFPETLLYTESTFRHLLHKYRSVIVKPNLGVHGNGVLKISKIMDRYRFQCDDVVKTFSNISLLIDYLQKVTANECYIVQKYIELATINERPFDLRVMVQRKIDHDWEITGQYAKVAKRGLIITNLKSKADVLPVEEVLLTLNVGEGQRRMQALVHSIALRTAQRLGERFTEHHIWGIDIAVDRYGCVWMIEANARPGFRGFQKLKDRSMYRTIMEVKRYNKELES
ncbi:YheC/YheD family protein [Desertibacillus haloalkaliphilus]|uniref:YheC/YheD family protein n=1 Tax=Desertibacillus haloalkaliphilus TaxID=1328930 RepID=UPI001C261819|nr:YheC/YheD family protein [Desertibacillus haloalkaliphilus]MBU8906022.1 YheC/YheD family protein [Desertibacillus haloalkaliphilus]